MPAFFWIGNDLACDFANTLAADDAGPVELLASFGDVARWLVEAQVIDADAGVRLARRARPTEARLLDDARAFRGSLRAVLDAASSGTSPPTRALAAINDRLLVPRPAAAIRHEAGGTFARGGPWPELDGRTLLLPIADAAATLLTTRDLGRLRRCGGPGCVLFFYDTTKNGTRRWCSMDGCGNRMKAAAHYRRTRGTA